MHRNFNISLPQLERVTTYKKFDCLTFLLFNPASKIARSKSTSYGKMPAPAG
jgi:hypothetical protein